MNNMNLKIYLYNNKHADKIKEGLDHCSGNITIDLPDAPSLDWKTEKQHYTDWTINSSYPERKQITVYSDKREDILFLTKCLVEMPG